MIAKGTQRRPRRPMRLRITDREMTTRRQTLSGQGCGLAMTVALCAVAESPGAAGLPLTDKLGGGDATFADAIDRARAQFAAGRYADAIQTLKVSAASGSNAEALVWLGRAYLELGDYASAASALERAVAFAPKDSEAHRWLGRAYGEEAARTRSLSLA